MLTLTQAKKWRERKFIQPFSYCGFIFYKLLDIQTFYFVPLIFNNIKSPTIILFFSL